MKTTALEVIGACDACQKSRAKFPAKQKQLHHTYKGVRLFQQWSIDSIPYSCGSNITLINCVDTFNKWIETLQIKCRGSQTVYDQF